MKVIKRLFRVSSPMLALAAGLALLAGLLWPWLRRRTCSSLFLVQARLPGPPLGLPEQILLIRSLLWGWAVGLGEGRQEGGDGA